MSEWKVIDPLNRLHTILIDFPFIFLIFQYLISHNKRINLVRFVLLLKFSLLQHDLSLIAQQILLFSPFSNLLTQISVPFLVYLFNDLPKLVLIDFPLENDAFIESIAHKSVHEPSHEGVRNARFPITATTFWQACIL